MPNGISIGLLVEHRGASVLLWILSCRGMRECTWGYAVQSPTLERGPGGCVNLRPVVGVRYDEEDR